MSGILSSVSRKKRRPPAILSGEFLPDAFCVLIWQALVSQQHVQDLTFRTYPHMQQPQKQCAPINQGKI